MPAFSRYVAIGDSTTEGLDDPDGHGGFRGWANRLADAVNAAQGGGLLYANLAIRGRVTRHIKEEQLARAVAMRPDLATVSAGTNDLLRWSFDAKQVGADIEEMLGALTGIGATTIIFTLPDLRDVMPIAKLFGERTLALNEEVRRACATTGALLLDLARHPVAADPRVWSDDRLHANSAGHARIAAAMAHLLGINNDASWSEPLPPLPPPTLADIAGAEWAWVRNHFAPWVWRHARGISSGDGRSAKRPELAPV